MKKSTIFWYIVSLCIIGMFHLNAMEIEHIAPVSRDKVCYLFAMPVEILNYIARWLMWESEKEFIERIKEVKEVPKKYHCWFPFETKRCSVWECIGLKGLNGFFSPDERKVALFELVCGICCGPRLVILDIEKEKEKGVVMHDGDLDKGYYRTMGLSCLGHMIAVIKKQQINNNASKGMYKDCLVIQKMPTKEVKTFEIPDCFVPLNLFFNKQGTHVALYGNDIKDESQECKRHIIFSLKSNDGAIENHDATDEKNVLQEYCRHNRICKTIVIRQ